MDNTTKKMKYIHYSVYICVCVNNKNHKNKSANLYSPVNIQM